MVVDENASDSTCRIKRRRQQTSCLYQTVLLIKSDKFLIDVGRYSRRECAAAMSCAKGVFGVYYDSSSPPLHVFCINYFVTKYT